LLIVLQVIYGKAKKICINAIFAFYTLLYPFVQELNDKTSRKKEKQRNCAKANSPWRASGELRQRAPDELATNTPWRVEGEKSRHGQSKASRWQGGTESKDQILPWQRNISRGELRRPNLLNKAETHW